MLIRLSDLNLPTEPPASHDAPAVHDHLTAAGLEVVRVFDPATAISGPLVIGRVLDVQELNGFRKPVRYARIDAGEAEPRSVVCAALNFGPGDLVVTALPGTTLADGTLITERTVYGVPSQGMLCSARDLHIGDDHSTIVIVREASDPGDDARSTGVLNDLTVELGPAAALQL